MPSDAPLAEDSTAIFQNSAVNSLIVHAKHSDHGQNLDDNSNRVLHQRTLAIMSTKIASQLELPQELWSMTIKEMRDFKSQSELAYLWTVVRNVSTFFKAEVERLFEVEHLIKTWLHADCGKLPALCSCLSAFHCS